MIIASGSYENRAAARLTDEASALWLTVLGCNKDSHLHCDIPMAFTGLQALSVEIPNSLYSILFKSGIFQLGNDSYDWQSRRLFF